MSFSRERQANRRRPMSTTVAVILVSTLLIIAILSGSYIAFIWWAELNISPEAFVAFMAMSAGVVAAVIALFRWVEDQDNAKHEQLRREISSEIRAEFYRHLLELNVAWLSANPQQREALKLSADEAESQLQEDNERNRT